MEVILLSALLFSQQHPLAQCPQQFVKLWQDNRVVALKHMPKRRCWYQAETGRYICDKDGCHR